MDKTVYLAMTGAKHTALAQAVNSHNLANINTPGFKADQVDFRSVYINDPNMGSRVYSVVNGIEAKLDSGSINATGNPLDVAVNGEGWFAVQGPDGNEAYTRAGNLRVVAGESGAFLGRVRSLVRPEILQRRGKAPRREHHGVQGIGAVKPGKPDEPHRLRPE